MKNISTPLVDEHLTSLVGMQEAGTDDFFYTRLKGRMQRQSEQGWSLPLKPVWVIGTLTLLLAVNGVMLFSKGRSATTSKVKTEASIQDFASSYDQTITSY